MHLLRLAPLPLALGCAPGLVGKGLPGDSAAGSGAGADGADGAGEGGGDGGGDDGGGDGAGTDTGVDVIPDGTAAASASPAGGAFVGRVEVLLDGGELGEVWACAADPGDPCDPAPAGPTLELTESAVLHVQARVGDRVVDHRAYAFIEVDPELSPFNSNLPLMVFYTDRSFPDTDSDRPVGVVVVEPGGGRAAITGAPTHSGRGRLRERGSSSASLDKPSFDMELWGPEGDDDLDVGLLGLPADGDWILYGPSYFDDAHIRNPLAFRVSEALGRYAPRTAFVEVYVATGRGSVGAGDYLGLYVLMEEIERGADRVDIARLDPDDLTEPDISGGYLFKRDRVADGERGFTAGEAGGTWSFDTRLVAVDPGEDALEWQQAAWLKDEIDSFGDALARPDGTDPSSGRHYSEIIDVGSFIDHHIVNLLMKNPDAFRLSGYFHKDRDGPIHAGPVWDFDRTAGSLDSRATDPIPWDATGLTSDTTPIFTYGWYEGLFADPDFADAYWTRLEGALSGDLSPEAVDALIVELADPLEEAAARNAARWGSPPWDAEVGWVRSWMDTRLRWMAACVAASPDPRSCPG